jgi:putative glycosyltransferase (TIGR04372 family)
MSKSFIFSNFLKKALNLLSNTKYWEVIVADQNAIGHNVGDFLNMAFEKYKRTDKKRIFLVYNQNSLSNEYILDIWRLIQRNLGGFKLLGIPLWLYRMICKFVVFSKQPSISQYSGCSGTDFDQELIARTKKIMINGLNLQKSDAIDELDNLKQRCSKVILILQRDSIFRGADPARDTPIEDLLESISYLLSNGFGVIRITKSSSSQINIIHPNLIDIPFTHEYSDLKFIKVFNIANYALSNWFGPMEMLRLYGVPTLFVNVPPTFREFPKRNKTFILLTKMRNSVGLSLEVEDFVEYYRSSYSPRDISALSDHGISLERNTPREILEALIEFLARVDLPHEIGCIRCTGTKKKLMELDLRNFNEGTQSPRIGEMEYSNILSKSGFTTAMFCLSKGSELFF